MHYIGKIDRDILGKEFEGLRSDNVVLTDERKQHIKERHMGDFSLFEKYNKIILEKPDVIIKDSKNENTIFVIKHIEETNVNVVIKLAVFNDAKHPENSIMTAYRIRDKNLRKLENRNKILYKQE